MNNPDPVPSLDSSPDPSPDPDPSWVFVCGTLDLRFPLA